MDDLYLPGQQTRNRLPLFAALKVTSPLHSEHNVTTEHFASFHNGAIGSVHQELGLAVQHENTMHGEQTTLE